MTAGGSVAAAKIIKNVGAKDENFRGTVRNPVTVASDGSINVNIKATGYQPGFETKTKYSYNFTFKQVTVAF